MTKADGFTLKTMSENADKRFSETEKRLSTMAGSFRRRMDGKTIGRLIGAIIGTLLWIAAFVVFYIYTSNMMISIIFQVSAPVVGALMLSLLIDTIIDISYYGRISSYGNSVTDLRNRITRGAGSINTDYDKFLNAKNKGWDMPLKVGSSIPDEAISIENAVVGMEKLKKGFINGLKNVLFFTAVIMVTIAGCDVLFEVGKGILDAVSGGEISDKLSDILCNIAVIISCIAEIILARLVWSATDCRVNGVTLLILPAGPIASILLIGIFALVALLAILIFQIIAQVLGIVLVGAIVVGCLSGG